MCDYYSEDFWTNYAPSELDVTQCKGADTSRWDDFGFQVQDALTDDFISPRDQGSITSDDMVVSSPDSAWYQHEITVAISKSGHRTERPGRSFKNVVMTPAKLQNMNLDVVLLEDSCDIVPTSLEELTASLDPQRRFPCISQGCPKVYRSDPT